MSGKRGAYRKIRQGWVADGVGYIPLTKGQVAKVDPEDVEWLSTYTWNALWSPSARKYYATCKDFRTGEELNLRMNRLVAGVDDPRIKVDHENRDTLDNRWDNLRPASQGENLCNRGKQINNTSGYKGVSWQADHGKWKACITRHGKTHHLGYFATREEAAEAYRVAAGEIHGEFACVA
jgi:hypothetical protein